MLVVAPFFKGTTINKNKRLDHELLRRPETDTLKYHEYKLCLINYTYRVMPIELSLVHLFLKSHLLTE